MLREKKNRRFTSLISDIIKANNVNIKTPTSASAAKREFSFAKAKSLKFHQLVVQRDQDHVLMIMPKKRRMLSSSNVRDLQGRDSLIRRCHLSERDKMKEYSFENKIFLCCHFLVTFARDTEISHLSVRGSEGQDDGRPSSPTMLSFPWGKDKHHLSNNFSHPDYIPESLLLCTIHRLQLLLIPGVVLLKLVVCVSFKSS